MSSRRSGYILVETAVALVILAIGAFAVQRTIQEAIRTRGQAQDFTQARFLLDQLMADITLQPELTEQRRRGRFPEPQSRFSWSYEIQRVDVPAPAQPLRPPPRGVKQKRFRYPEESAYMARVRATVRWERAGMSFSESYETLLPADRLWQPPKRRRQ